MPDAQALMPCGICDLKARKVQVISDDQSAIAFRCAPAKAWRINKKARLPGISFLQPEYSPAECINEYVLKKSIPCPKANLVFFRSSTRPPLSGSQESTHQASQS